MKKKAFKDSKAFQAACLMPGGQNHQPNEIFDISKSEAVIWLINNPTIQKYIFEKCNQSGAIVFDPNSKTWRGVLHPKISETEIIR